MSDSYADHRTRRGDPRYTFDGQPIISDQIDRQGIRAVCTNLEAVLTAGTPGHIVELGCYVGTTSLFIRRLLDKHDESEQRTFHAYDSFIGLPPKQRQDENAAGVDFQAGELFVSKKELLQAFQRASLQPPVIHKGWFADLSPNDLPQPIAFAFLDGDFYGSILDSLRLVWPRMTTGGRVLIDDYFHDALPGVERAVRDFFQGRAPRIRRDGAIAIIKT